MTAATARTRAAVSIRSKEIRTGMWNASRASPSRSVSQTPCWAGEAGLRSGRGRTSDIQRLT